jgi:ribosomal protein S18 acetylase RimI-like enzyme
MSTEAGLRLYEKHGFKIVKRIVQSVEEWGGTIPHVHYFLVKTPEDHGYLTPPREMEL